MNRREFVSYAWLASVAAVAAVGLGLGGRFARSRSPLGRFGGRFNMGPLSQLPPPGSPPLNQPVGRFWLVNTQAGLLAPHKACTHLDCLCEWDSENRQYVCPCHGSRFAEDGTYLAGPAPRGLDRFAVQVVTPSGKVVTETDPATGAPLPVPGSQRLPESASPSGADSDAALLLIVDTGLAYQGPPAT